MASGAHPSTCGTLRQTRRKRSGSWAAPRAPARAGGTSLSSHEPVLPPRNSSSRWRPEAAFPPRSRLATAWLVAWWGVPSRHGASATRRARAAVPPLPARPPARTPSSATSRELERRSRRYSQRRLRRPRWRLRWGPCWRSHRCPCRQPRWRFACREPQPRRGSRPSALESPRERRWGSCRPWSRPLSHPLRWRRLCLSKRGSWASRSRLRPTAPFQPSR